MAAAAVAALVASCKDIVPQAYDPGLSVDKSEIDFRYAGGDAVLKITSSQPWTLDLGGCDWISPSMTSGEGTAKVILTSEVYLDETSDREAELTIVSGEDSNTIYISQSRYIPYIEVRVNTGTEAEPVWETMTECEVGSVLTNPEQKIRIQIETNSAWSIDTPAGVTASKEQGGETALVEPVIETVELKLSYVAGGQEVTLSTVNFKIEGEQAAALSIRQTNPYSNCFVINTPGTYSILPNKPDGTPVNATSATWMFETEEGLISGTPPVLADGKITFTVAESNLPDVQKGGYGIITLMNGDEVAYSYAIWYTKKLRDIQIGNDIFLDRNLMAWTDNLPAADFGNKSVPGSYGCLYQWGCKNPLPCPSEQAIADIDNDRESAHHDDMFTEDYLLQGHFNTGFKNPDGTASVYYSNSNSVPMNSDSQTKYPWLLIGSQYDLTQEERWSETRKTVDDPCPAGYKVPSIDQLVAMYSILGNSHTQPFWDNGMENWSKVYTLNGVTFSFMNPGIIQYNKKGGSKPWRDTRNTVGSPETYHSSSGFQSEYDGTPGTNNTICCQFLSNRARMDKFDTRAAAAIRCVKIKQ